MPKVIPTRKKNQELYQLVQEVKTPGGQRLGVEKVADLIGISAPTLYDLINKRRRPTKETAKKIGTYFGVEPGDLFKVII